MVIGGGLLGLEAAAGLEQQGMDVTVVHLMPTLMERQLDPAAGYLLQQAIEARGIKVITKANTKAILGDGKVEAVELDDGTRDPGRPRRHGGRHPAERMARQGGGPRRSSAASWSTTTCAPPIPTSSRSANAPSSADSVYGLVAPLYEMARVAAAQLAGDDAASFVHADTPTKLKVTGIDLFSAGDFADGEDREEIVLRDAARGVYKRLVLKDNRIIGAVLYGETADGAWFFDLLKQQDRCRRHARDADLRPGLSGRRRRWTLWRPLQPCRMMPKSAAATASARARSPARSPAKGLTIARRRARPHQGLGLLRLLHRPGRAAADADARRRLQSSRRAADVRLHRRSATTTCAA